LFGVGARTSPVVPVVAAVPAFGVALLAEREEHGPGALHRDSRNLGELACSLPLVGEREQHAALWFGLGCTLGARSAL
jgi:hypothetical protein